MEGIHERFFVPVRSRGKVREFEVVPSVGHYAILENEETVAEIIIGEKGLQVKNNVLPKTVMQSLLEKIQEHEL
ncbi:hypothetical protein GCM10027049_18630 [Mucilaginibacter puniceus]